MARFKQRDIAVIIGNRARHFYPLGEEVMVHQCSYEGTSNEYYTTSSIAGLDSWCAYWDDLQLKAVAPTKRIGFR
jgi:hypothetical protein